MPSRRARACTALAIGTTFAALTSVLVRGRGPLEWVQAGDLTYPWLAARAVLHGVDPYVAVQSLHRPFGRTLFYPLPAALVAIPLAPLAPRIAAAVLVAVGCALLAFAVTRKQWWPLLMFASAPAYQAAYAVQWSPLLAASSFYAPAMWLSCVKPNLALALLVRQRSWRGLWWLVLGSIALFAIGLVLFPRWPLEWLATFRDPVASQYEIPLVTRYGAVLVLAALRWREPRAQLLLAMAVTPQNGFFYDQFPLLLIARSRLELAILAVSSLVGLLITSALPIAVSEASAMSRTYMPVVIASMYLPALALVLWKQSVK